MQYSKKRMQNYAVCSLLHYLENQRKGYRLGIENLCLPDITNKNMRVMQSLIHRSSWSNERLTFHSEAVKISLLRSL